MYLSTELSTGDVDKKYAPQNLYKSVKKKKYFFDFFIKNPKKYQLIQNIYKILIITEKNII